eukprot:Blabericola_migrator_1__4790@NODE_2519_length_2653_cov_12_921114_g1575_i0_p5_GENE_NODE_2519_length_2653_cov_12_921114_g1575_i0NODE_2519_length_2653_cov_12_921114_g1575_i0_p5_ORF_typecomplete_len115_score9_88_NODE_2519_length_2653_cov_12_921114_g1575_i010581402
MEFDADFHLSQLRSTASPRSRRGRSGLRRRFTLRCRRPFLMTTSNPAYIPDTLRENILSRSTLEAREHIKLALTTLCGILPPLSDTALASAVTFNRPPTAIVATELVYMLPMAF